MLELGTKNSRLWRSSKNDWFEGTKGFIGAATSAKDAAVKLEALPADSEKLLDKITWKADDRDHAWLKFYKQYAGKIDTSRGTQSVHGIASGRAKLTGREVHNRGDGEKARNARDLRPADRQAVEAEPKPTPRLPGNSDS